MGLTNILFHKTERRRLIARLFGYDMTDVSLSKFQRWVLKNYQLTVALLILIVVIKIIIAIAIYNDFNTASQEVNNARANIEGCLQMRENLISQLVTTMYDFVKHEDTVFFHSSDVRASSISPGQQPDTKSSKSGQKETPKDNLQDLFSRLIAVAESYPELKTSESFQILMSKTADVEKEILDKRIDYNAKAYKFNKKATSIPGNIYAFLYGFKQVEYFQWEGEPGWVSRKIAE